MYGYGFEEVMGGVASGAMGIVAGMMLVLYFLTVGASLVMYVLNAVGIYRIAKRRGIHHSWLAWVPIGSSWVLGSISDHYQYVVNHKKTYKRKILLILGIVLAVVALLVLGAVVALMLTSGSAGESAAFSLAIALLVLAYLVMAGVAITYTVFHYIAYYDLFRSSKPNNAILFLVLSIIFNVTLAFFVFACGNSDEGMPERRPRTPASAIPDQSETEPNVQEEEEIPVVETEIVEDPE